MNPKITGIIIAKNEEKNIKRAIISLKFCDEIIVIDDYSTDKTAKISKSLGGKVYQNKLNGDFGNQRNFGLKKAKTEWVIFLDADEIVSPKLAKEIQVKIQNENFNGYYIKRCLYFFNKKITHGEIGDTYLLRLGRKSEGKWKRSIHEKWIIEGRIGKLENPLLHYQNNDLYSLIKNINKYSKIHAEENKKENKKFNFLFVIFHPLGKFFVFYLLKFGFLDGIEGFILAILMSFHSFLAWSQLWINSQKYKKN